ncbi:hypothetical protein M427DRAFT_58177 [Gonapodya prolifera JEL478]|uniref:homogentisate 1,2-dioxygenase n=1 Tax=Gonapodya prolifera (strain JEL478) TaxID=1344416 RepID=A0A139AB07_GONPJ|nr:hypothetical protein M427DRAFT_58177 [Gonapodya prolifera JEL478]|eukprot:KXS13927.1 hypothetical protein M427DRAFT_58177 [Gonapodya prolifera JEL478]
MAAPQAPDSAAPWVPSNPNGPSRSPPVGQNSPQICPYKTYPECINGTAFTAPRHSNQRVWLYRMVASVAQSKFRPYLKNKYVTSEFHNIDPRNPSSVKTQDGVHQAPNQTQWSPFKLPGKDEKVDFIDGLKTLIGAGHPSLRHGIATHVYLANVGMGKKTFYNSDGDFLIVPQQGVLDIITELGKLSVAPNEIAVIQRGIRFSVNLPDGPSRGYVGEIYSSHFELPDLGPIGANGLANPRDFLHPTAWFEHDDSAWTVVTKYGGKLYDADLRGSPYNVLGWHGNYVPYKYDLQRFQVINSVSFDHNDPSIFTVLTCQSPLAGHAYLDFVIFPPRWSVASWTFRPPFFHRNGMSEFLGLIKGDFGDYKQGHEGQEIGLFPGGGYVHTMMGAHGPEAKAFETFSKIPLDPVRVGDGSQPFMFESYLQVGYTKWAWSECGVVQENYVTDEWGDLGKSFDPNFKGQHATKPKL